MLTGTLLSRTYVIITVLVAFNSTAMKMIILIMVPHERQ